MSDLIFCAQEKELYETDTDIKAPVTDTAQKPLSTR